jgi:hypothetical protein
MPPAKTETTEIELTGFTLPANVRLQMGESGLMLGGHYANGMRASGPVERMTYIGGGVIRVTINGINLLIFSSGMVAEDK